LVLSGYPRYALANSAIEDEANLSLSCAIYEEDMDILLRLRAMLSKGHTRHQFYLMPRRKPAPPGRRMALLMVTTRLRKTGIPETETREFGLVW
jgi:hypothetical protein